MTLQHATRLLWKLHPKLKFSLVHKPPLFLFFTGLHSVKYTEVERKSKNKNRGGLRMRNPCGLVKCILTTVDRHITSVVAECTDGCAILTREEVKVVGRVTVHTVQENSATALAKAEVEIVYVHFNFKAYFHHYSIICTANRSICVSAAKQCKGASNCHTLSSYVI